MFNILATKYKQLTKTNDFNGLFVFSTMLQKGVKAHLLESHCERLRRHAVIAGFPKKHLEKIFEITSKLLYKNPTPSFSKTRVQLHFSDDSGFMITLKQSPAILSNATCEFAVEIIHTNFTPQPSERIKTNNYLPYFELVHDSGRQLFTNKKDNITSGLFENFFMINTQDKKITTPPVDSLVLNGITRNWVLRKCKHLGWKIAEQNIHVDEITQNKAAFFSSSIQGIIPITRIGEKSLLHSDMTKTLSDVFNYSILQELDR